MSTMSKPTLMNKKKMLKNMRRSNGLGLPVVSELLGNGNGYDEASASQDCFI